MAWLEEPNMKYIVEFGGVGKLQPIHNITNLLHDEEWAIKSWSQFAAAFDVEQREWVMDQAQPDILANSEGDIPMLVIIVMFVPLLRLFESFTHL
jgi:hypothetical protein